MFKFVFASAVLALMLGGCAGGGVYAKAGVDAGYRAEEPVLPVRMAGYYGGLYQSGPGYGRQHTGRRSRCNGGDIYVVGRNACVRHGPPTADYRGDPECRDKPSGYRFDRAVIGPNGMRGVDHRVCY